MSSKEGALYNSMILIPHRGVRKMKGNKTMSQNDLDFILQSLIQRSERVNSESTGLISEVVGIIGGFVTAQERNAADFRQRLAMIGQPSPQPQQQQAWPATPQAGGPNWRTAAARIPS